MGLCVCLERPRVTPRLPVCLLYHSHANSVDKFPDGDYLLSGRITNAIYKISSKDGTIVWRLGGKNSDFKFDDEFSGQHDARVRKQNDTHTIISLLDNAMVKPDTTNDQSRGLVLALRTDTNPLTAEVEARYNHPQGGYAPGRGNFQILPSGNAFLGWTVHALHSEHTPDGKVIMEASLKPELKSYRNYKFPWVGHPTKPPDVHSAAFSVGDNNTTTIVYVSWNGATEVGSWNVFKTTKNGGARTLVAAGLRKGFETSLAISGFAAFVVIEAVDANGEALGESEVTESVQPSNTLSPAVVQEKQWLEEHSLGYTGSGAGGVLGSSTFTFALGLLGCVIVALLLKVSLYRKRPAQHVYEPLQGSDPNEVELEVRKKDDDYERQNGVAVHDNGG